MMATHTRYPVICRTRLPPNGGYAANLLARKATTSVDTRINYCRYMHDISFETRSFHGVYTNEHAVYRNKKTVFLVIFLNLFTRHVDTTCYDVDVSHVGNKQCIIRNA